MVVDTTHLTAETCMNNGFNRSDALHMAERFRPSGDGETLWLALTYEDPAVSDGSAARYMAWTRGRGEHNHPYDCDPSCGE